MKYIFGPVPSRRFGKSLGIDLSSSTKQCNFDCLYCELSPAKVIEEQTIVDNLDDIKSEILQAINLHENLDVITLTANGEPTLYPYLDELIDFINIHKGEAKSLILTNSSTIMDAKMRETLAKLDIVKLSLDAISPKVFKKIDRAVHSIEITQIIDGIKKFKEIYKGDLILEILFVKGVNDSIEEVLKLAQTIQKIAPTRLDLNTIDRPPAYEVSGLSFEELQTIASYFQTNVTIAKRNSSEKRESYSKDEILNTLSKRPLNSFDIQNLMSKESILVLDKLIKEKQVEIQNVAGVDFYVSNI